MWFGVLGPVEVRSATGSPLPVGGPRLRALLAMLLLDAGQVITRDRLVAGLWGAKPPADATNALQSQVSRLRRALPDHGEVRVQAHPAGYRLAVAAEDVDVHRFATLADAGRQALAAGDHPLAAAHLGAALRLWRGPALADIATAPFAAAQVTRLTEQRLTVVEDWAEAELHLGDPDHLLTALRDEVAAHPLRERLYVLLIRALHAVGRRAEALTVFEEVRRLLADELGTDPSADLRAVHLAVLRSDDGPTPGHPDRAGPPPAAPEVVAARLTRPPAPLTSFVGRVEELTRTSHLLDGTRLVTVVGPGGAGKTRFAVEVARRRGAGVCFVDLSLVTDGTQVPQAILRALGLRDITRLKALGAAGDPVDRLVAALSDQPVLLLMDNCEHVLTPTARVVRRLLADCPDLRVLATSRAALGITGEVRCPLPPLALPPPDADARTALDYPTVRLFHERATAVRPDFTVGPDTVDVVRRICTALDGLPLAIELAAVRLRALPVQAVADRLDDRFRLLSRGDPTAAPRHRTLRAVVGWSWELLSPDERALARRLTVFVGGATGAAAVQVCDPDGADVSDLLTDLVDRSIVEWTGSRYRMLESIREYGAEQLVEAGERERLCRAHAEYFLDLARTADPELRGPAQLSWADRLSAEHANLHAALAWAVSADPHLALRLVAALAWYWNLRGIRGEVAPAVTELLDRIGPEPPAELTEEYLVCAMLDLATGKPGRYDQNRLAAIEAMATALGRPVRQPFLVVTLVQATGPPAHDLTARLRLLGSDRWFKGLIHLGWGYLRLFDGDLAGAEPGLHEALVSFRASGDRWGVSQALDGLSTLADLRGDPHTALALSAEAIDLVTQLAALEEVAELRCRRAERLIRAGRLAEAQAEYAAAAELARRIGLHGILVLTRYGQGELARLAGDLATARHRYESALADCPADWPNSEVRSRLLTGLGRLAEADGAVPEACSRHQAALAAALTSGFPQCVAAAADGLAGAVLLDGDAGGAARLLGMATAVRGGHVPGYPDRGRTVAGIRSRLGDQAYAEAHASGTGLTRVEQLALLRTLADAD
ncbi:AfsR/SARP family transcriptional regulator [Micromonospora craterilacus]|uniref:AfsR/SARP family transcriptional regulator n=1 Tax=Micromonospora craterilacus TaxID=1655439 RepID=A0A2W2ET91_9ACTN|nr:BTAD domain-containing putative transcriptional regulator [Micromonospora craterilacus]PZG19969.1 AfsR/SARP family transcriptional regulator [Micromonospora craterilacus]